MGLMERRGQIGHVVERIAAAARPVVLLRGPAGSGKTGAVMEVVRRVADGGPMARCGLLVPGAAAAGWVRRRLVAESPGGVAIGPRVQTFAALAEEVLAAAGVAARTLSPLRRNLLLRTIVDESAAAGRIPVLAPVADTPGLVVALDRAISELKRAAVEPDALAAALDRVGATAGKARDLLTIYRAVQQRLHDEDLYDVEGRMWLARDALRDAGANAGLGELAAIAVDGFTDFTPTQLEILALLSRRLERVLITLPYAEDGRDRMWHWTRRTLNNIRAAFGDDLEEIQTLPGDEGGSAGRGLWRRVFDFDAPPLEPPEGLHIIAAAGPEAEVAAIARRVKALLVGGVRPGEIAVLARSMDAYRPIVERVFAAYQVPLAAAPAPLTEARIVRFALNVASLAPQFAFRDVLGVVKSSYFRPPSLGPFDAQTVAVAEMVIRRGNVLEGADAYARAVERLAARGPRLTDEEQEPEAIDLGPISADAETIRAAGEMLRSLFDLATNGLGRIVEALELHRVAAESGDPQLAARDLRALAALDQALSEVPAAIRDPSRLGELLRAAVCPAARGESVVDALDVLDGRAMRYRHVLLLGAAEGQFPRRFTESSLIGESDRAAWGRFGVNLDSRRDLTAREMLLFYLAISRTDGGLTISFQESDRGGRAGACGSFLESMLRPVGGLEALAARGALEKIPPGQFLPPAPQIASVSEAVGAAVAGLFHSGADPRGGALSWTAAHAPQSIRAAARGLLARSARWAPGACGAHDGRLADATLLEQLARRFPEQTVFSATALNAYAQCPWSFFARYVLHLSPLDVPERELEPVTRGIFCHNALFGAMRRLQERSGGPVQLAALAEAEIFEALDEAIAAECEAVAASRPPYPVLWDIQRDRMRDELRDYLRRQRGAGLDAESLHFELAFGTVAHDPGARDPASRAEAVELSTPAGEIRVQGKIDRVDRVRVEDVAGLLVVDYKTGRLPAAAEIDGGQNVQLALYAAALEQIAGEAVLGGAFDKVARGKEAGKRTMQAAVKASRGRYAVDEEYDQKRETVFARIGEHVDGMRGGRFDVMGVHDCPSYCPYRQICGYSDARAEAKRREDAE